MMNRDRLPLRLGPGDPCRLASALAMSALALAWPGSAQEPPRPMTVDDVLSIKGVGPVALSPSGDQVAFVVSERAFDADGSDSQLWLVSAQGGDARRLTRNPGSDGSPQWSPDGSWIAFTSDRGENRQVWGIRPDGGEAWQVTDAPTGVGGFRLSPDGSAVAWTASLEKSESDTELEETRGRPMVWDSVYADQWSVLWSAPLHDGSAGESSRRSPAGQHVTGFAWAPDSRGLAWSARPSPDLRSGLQGSVWVQDDADGEARQSADLPGGEGVVAWTPEQGLLIGASGHELGTENGHLWRADPSGASGPVPLTEALDEHAGFVAARQDGLLVEAAHRTGRRLYWIPVRDGAGGAPRVVGDCELFCRGFSADESGARVAFLGESPSSARDVYVSSVEDFSPRRITEVNPAVAEMALGETRIVRWRSQADGEEIEGVLTLPVGYREGERVPLLLRIHGGPSGVSTMSFHGDDGAYPTQVFAGLGYAVLQPNYRGSTGYGERFRGLNRGDISGRDWVDVNSGVDHLVDQGVADADRLGIMGWSFGGHHTFWGITQTDRFRAASAGAGANDLVSMYSQTDFHEFYDLYLGPRPWEDFDLYEDRSAYRRVADVTTPLLIQVGERDERVPAEQSIQFYVAMRAIGRAPVKLVVYPGQPHGIRSPRLQRDLLQRNVAWFQRWIPTESAVSDQGG